MAQRTRTRGAGLARAESAAPPAKRGRVASPAAVVRRPAAAPRRPSRAEDSVPSPRHLSGRGIMTYPAAPAHDDCAESRSNLEKGSSDSSAGTLATDAQGPAVDGASSGSSAGKSAADAEALGLNGTPDGQVSEPIIIGREEERATLASFLSQTLGAAKGGFLYVSGGPGTGKTCCVRASLQEWKSQAPLLLTLEVNCMDLPQRCVATLYDHIGERLGLRPTRRGSRQDPQDQAIALVGALRARGCPIALVVDEVDQLRGDEHGPGPLQRLISLPLLPGAPPLSVIAIANTPNLIERSGLRFKDLPRCSSLLFTGYTSEQLSRIVREKLVRVDGMATFKGPALELCVRQAARMYGGDCRQSLNLCEQAIQEVAGYTAPSPVRVVVPEASRNGARAAPGTPPVREGTPGSPPGTPRTMGASPSRLGRPDPATPQRSQRQLCKQMSDPKTEVPTPNRTMLSILKRSSRCDPLATVASLPIKLQLVLCAFVNGGGEALMVDEVRQRYKAACLKLKQPEDLGTRGQVAQALEALGGRGLLSVRKTRARGSVAELAVKSELVRERLMECPVKRCLS